MSSGASDGLAEAFRSAGFVRVPSLFTADHVANLNRLVDGCFDGTLSPDLHLHETQLMRSEAQYRADLSGPGADVRVALHLCHTYTGFRAHALSREIDAVLRRLSTDQIHLYTDLLFNKRPFTGEQLEFHQDAAYYPEFDCAEIISCWTALDDTDIDNGCLEFVAGSHGRLRQHRRTGGQQALVLDDPGLAGEVLTPVPSRAGDCVFHHGFIVHRSGRNASERRRRGIATIFLIGLKNPPRSTLPFPILPLPSA